MSPASDIPAPLRARFTPRRRLGAGGYGEVWLVDEPAVPRPVALKLLHADATDEDTARRFQREARVTAGLQHPHVVGIYDHGVADGRPWIAYEYVEGASLADSGGGAPVEQVIRWGQQLASALAAAHAADVVHRDVKPANVLRRPDGDVVLTDFGIARSSREGTQVTQDGLVFGTPEYMAPEVLLGGAATPAADQFALAITLVELLLGATPRAGADLATLLRSARDQARVPLDPALRQRAGDIYPCLERALDPNPGRRFPDLDDFGAALAGRSPGPQSGIVTPRRRPVPDANGAVTPRKPEQEDPARRRGRGRPRQPAAGRLAARVLGGLVLGLVAVALWTGLGDSRPHQHDLLAVIQASNLEELAAEASALRTTVAEVLAQHDIEDGVLPTLEREAHVQARRGALLDDPGPGLGRRLIERLSRWLEARRRAGVEGDPHLEGAVIHVLDDLLNDYHLLGTQVRAEPWAQALAYPEDGRPNLRTQAAALEAVAAVYRNLAQEVSTGLTDGRLPHTWFTSLVRLLLTHIGATKTSDAVDSPTETGELLAAVDDLLPFLRAPARSIQGVQGRVAALKLLRDKGNLSLPIGARLPRIVEVARLAARDPFPADSSYQLAECLVSIPRLLYDLAISPTPAHLAHAKEVLALARGFPEDERWRFAEILRAEGELADPEQRAFLMKDPGWAEVLGALRDWGMRWDVVR